MKYSELLALQKTNKDRFIQESKERIGEEYEHAIYQSGTRGFPISLTMNKCLSLTMGEECELIHDYLSEMGYNNFTVNTSEDSRGTTVKSVIHITIAENLR